MINLTFSIPGKLIKGELTTQTVQSMADAINGNKVIKKVEIRHRPLIQESATQKTVISDEAQAFFQSPESKPGSVRPNEWLKMSAKERLEYHLFTLAGSWDYHYEFIK